MIPVASSNPHRAGWLEVVRRRTAPLIDYERGGEAIGNPAGGLLGHQYRAELIGGDVVVFRDEETSGTPVYNYPTATRIALSFDQNMRVHLAFESGAGMQLWWYDSVAGAMTLTNLTGTDPCLCTDEKRPALLSDSDVILSYKNGTNLCVRVQRERFQTEHVLATDVPGILVCAGMNTALRMQWKLLG